jgi:hypothetical protein
MSKPGEPGVFTRLLKICPQIRTAPIANANAEKQRWTQVCSSIGDDNLDSLFDHITNGLQNASTKDLATLKVREFFKARLNSPHLFYEYFVKIHNEKTQILEEVRAIVSSVLQLHYPELTSNSIADEVGKLSQFILMTNSNIKHINTKRKRFGNMDPNPPIEALKKFYPTAASSPKKPRIEE